MDKRWITAGGILLLALALRGIYWTQHAHSPFADPVILDPGYYHTWALRMAQGQWIEKNAAFGLPLYPFFLSLAYRLAGVNPLSVQGFQLILGVGHCFLIYLLSLRLFKRHGLAALASLMGTLYAPYIFHEAMLVPEALSLPLYTASLILSLSYWESPTLRKALFLGLLWVLSGLTKPGIFLYGFVFLGAYLMGHKDPFPKKIKKSLVTLAVVLAGILPVTLHNAFASGDFVLLTWHGGLNFYIGNNPQADGIFETPPGIRSNIEGQIADSKDLAEKALGRRLKPSEVSRFWFEKGIQFILQNPKAALLLAARKFTLLINVREISDVESIEFSKRFIPLLRYLPLDFSLLFALSLPGMFLGFGHLKASHRWILGMWLTAYTLGVILFFVNARYRLPILSSLFPFAAWTVFELIEAVKMRKALRMGVLFIGILASFAVTQPRLVEARPGVQETNAGNILASQSKYLEAIAFYREAVRLNPHYGKAYNDLGVALQMIERWDEAKEAFQNAIRVDLNNPYPYNNLGLLMDRRGRPDLALHYFNKALSIQPNLAEAHNNIGMILAKTGDFESAEKEFLKTLEQNPENQKAMANLGFLRFYQGRLEEARELWERVLKINPRNPDALKGLKELERTL